MANQKWGMFPVDVARRIYTNAGGGSSREHKEFTQPSGGKKALHFFELVEDMPAGHGGRAWANILNWAKDTISSDWVYNWGDSSDGIIGFVPAGFFGTCATILGRKAFNQAECNQKCISGTYIPVQTPTDAITGQDDYSYTMTVTGTVDTASFAASGLPTNWAIDATTGEITGPDAGDGGVAEAAGTEIAVIVTATAPKDGGGTCTITRRIVITVVAE